MLPTITSDKIDLPPRTLLHFPATLDDYEQILTQLCDRSMPVARSYQSQLITNSIIRELSLDKRPGQQELQSSVKMLHDRGKIYLLQKKVIS